VKTVCLLVSFIASASCGYAQLEQYQLTKPSLHEVPSIEKKMRGKKVDYNFNVTVSKNYFPGAASFNLANPLVYYRPATNGRVEVSYFYSQPDRVVRLIEYSFDKPASDSTLLKQFFTANENYFGNWFKKRGSVTTEVHDNWWQQLEVWENDTVYVKQFIVVGDATYRVRVLVSWKR